MKATLGERLLLVLPLLLAAGAVHLAASSAAPASGPSPAAAPIRCKPGTVRAVVLGKQQCLRAGIRCLRRHDRAYHRYGFHCHGPRLTRFPQRAPTPAPGPAPAPTPAPRPEAPVGTISFTGYPSDAVYPHWDDVPSLPEPRYAESPPVGGIHRVYWARCRFFEEVLDDGFTVHSLEHGAVWLAYRPDLGAEDLAVLRELVDGRREILASPYPGLSEPVVALAWARQLRLDSVRDPRLAQFVEAFHDAPHAPQAFIHTCTSPVG